LDWGGGLKYKNIGFVFDQKLPSSAQPDMFKGRRSCKFSSQWI